ncbi:succinic semialdehyde dehydrogenase [Halalkalirubrum salinum]|uniref:succinic semialdehyde dehydrogenase n=1 Tax=Halalkalirubrum salinum TaxID=2563889 RepID=UPI0010FAD291|nr:succinic semialdehyde dehydrogenase [Halalkalirubrum salinum]
MSSPAGARRRAGERCVTLADRVDAAAAESIAVRSPPTDEVIAQVPDCSRDDVETIVDRARAAQTTWTEWPVEKRVAVLDRFCDSLLEHRRDLLDLIQLETGKPRHNAVEELLDAVGTCTYYVDTAPKLVESERRSGAFPAITDARVHYEPVGVVGVISPWNYPFNLSLTDAIPALAAGNAVVCKPDERTPFATLFAASLLEAAGAPPGLFAVATGRGETTGPALVDAVDHISFTGGTETGRAVAERAGQNLIDCSLELGGKNPFIVLDDANISAAVRGAVAGAFANAGQLCLAPERIYVHESVYEPFLAELCSATESLSIGFEFGYGPDVGSMIDGDHVDRVDGYVQEAIDDGASCHVGGRRRPDVGPHFYEPTILTGVDPDSRIACEETFGPVVSVTPVKDAATAIDMATNTTYGLNGSVWTTDLGRGRHVATSLDCGTVCINDPYLVGWAALDAPMGGVGDSGLGRRHGPEGLRRYLESRTIATSRIGPFVSPSIVPMGLYARALVGSARLQRRLTRLKRRLSPR